MNASMRERRKELSRTLVATRDVTRAQRDAARDELRAMELRRMDVLRRHRARIQTDVAAAQTAVLQQPPGMTAVPTYLISAIGALAAYIDEHHAVLEESSEAYLESLELLRPAGEDLPPPFRLLDARRMAMGWGDPPHEGYEARLLRDGRMVGVWSAETDRESTGLVVVLCCCGWRGDGLYRDYGLNAEGRRWWPDLDSEAQDQAMHDEWWNRHMAPLVDPDPDSVLALGSDAGGLRHFLAGQPVHAGTYLELRLPDDRWVLIRYEWNWDPAVRPRAYLALGGRGEALGYAPVVEFALPERAELRWPAEPMGRRL